MSEQNSQNQQPRQDWEDVLDQFKAFGESLGRAVENGWNDRRTQDVVDQIKDGLRKAADEIEGAVDHAKDDPAVQDFCDEAKGAFKDLEETGKEAFDKAKPHIIKAMHNLNEAISNAIRGMDGPEEKDRPQ